MSANEFCKPLHVYNPEEAASQHAEFLRSFDSEKNYKQISLLRIIIICLLLTNAVQTYALVIQSNKSIMVPWVIEKDANGQFTALGMAKQTNYNPQERDKQHYIEQFIEDTRTIPLDPVVAKKQWSRAAVFITQSARTKLQEEFKKDNMTGRLGIETTQIQMKSNVAQSGDTYQVRWIEEIYAKDGTLKDRYNMVGSFTIEVGKIKTEEEWRLNPLGLFIKNFDWKRELR